MSGFSLGIAHFGAGLAVLILQNFHDDFNSKYQVFYNQPYWVDCNNSSRVYPYESDITNNIHDYCKDFIVNSTVKSMFYNHRYYLEVDFAYIVAVYFIVTGLWHFAYVFPWVWTHYVEERLNENRNIELRWIEYGPTSGLMLFVIAYFIGIEDLSVLILLSVMEMLAIMSIAWVSLPYGVILPSLINGSIFTFFFVRYGLLFSPEGANFDDMPWFVTAIIIGEFLMFQSFPIIYVIEQRRLASALIVEFLYYMLSATSKLFLGVIAVFYIFI